MILVPLQPVPAQTVSVSLGGQACTLNIYQKNASILVDCGSLYIDVYVSGTLIIGGVVCQYANVIVRDVYLGFIGDLAFYDLLGTDDPDYSGLGSRWVLGYLSPAELATAGLAG